MISRRGFFSILAGAAALAVLPLTTRREGWWEIRLEGSGTNYALAEGSWDDMIDMCRYFPTYRIASLNRLDAQGATIKFWTQ